VVRRGSFFGEHRRQAFTVAPAGRGESSSAKGSTVRRLQGWRGQWGSLEER